MKDENQTDNNQMFYWNDVKSQTNNDKEMKADSPYNFKCLLGNFKITFHFER